MVEHRSVAAATRVRFSSGTPKIYPHSAYIMQKLLFVLSIVVLLAAGCNPTQTIFTNNLNQTATVQNTSQDSPTANLPALSLVNDLRNALVQQGFKMNTSTPSDIWWLDTNGIAVNVRTATSLNFIITEKAKDDYSVSDMNNDPAIAQAATTVKNYMDTKGLVLNASQSANSTNANLSPYIYTQAFSSSNNVRCRLDIENPYSGVGETPPYTFTATIACADNQAYSEAYNKQAPLFKAIAGKLNAKDIILIDNDFNGVCKNDAKITNIEIVDLSQGSTGYYSLTKSGNTWVDSGMTPYEMNLHCR